METEGAGAPSKAKLFTFNFVCGTVLHFALMTNYFCLMVIIADYSMVQFGAPTAIATTATGTFVIAALFARLATEFVLGRFGLRFMLVGSATLEVICSVLYLVVGDVWVLIALRIVHGFAFGLASTAAAAAVTGSIPVERRGEGIGYFMLGSPLGAAVGPAVSIALMRSFGFPAVFLFAIGAAGVQFVLSLIVRAPAHEAVAKREKRSFSEWLHGVVEFRAIPIGIVALVMYFAYSSLLAFMNSYATERGLGEAAVWFFAVYAGSMVVTRPFTGRAFDRIGEKVAFVPAFFSFAIGMIMLWTATSPVALLAAAALLGYGVGSVQSCGLAVAVNLVEPERVAVSNSTYFMLLDAGVGGGPIVHGVFVSLVGKEVLWPVMAVVGLLDLVIYLFVSRNQAKDRS